MTHSTEKELWKWIPGYRGYYKASTFGRIKSIDRWVNHPKGGKKIVRGRILKSGIASNGYLTVSLLGISKTVHSLILSTFRGPCPLGMEARHLNDVKTDNRLSNLKWGTHKINCLDVISNKGRYGTSILDPTDIRKIRKLHQTGKYTLKQLGARFNTHFGNIHTIVKRKTWKHE
jgi:hypothetical protein